MTCGLGPFRDNIPHGISPGKTWEQYILFCFLLSSLHVQLYSRPFFVCVLSVQNTRRKTWEGEEGGQRQQRYREHLYRKQKAKSASTAADSVLRQVEPQHFFCFRGTDTIQFVASVGARGEAGEESGISCHATSEGRRGMVGVLLQVVRFFSPQVHVRVVCVCRFLFSQNLGAGPGNGPIYVGR